MRMVARLACGIAALATTIVMWPVAASAAAAPGSTVDLTLTSFGTAGGNVLRSVTLTLHR